MVPFRWIHPRVKHFLCSEHSTSYTLTMWVFRLYWWNWKIHKATSLIITLVLKEIANSHNHENIATFKSPIKFVHRMSVHWLCPSASWQEPGVEITARPLARGEWKPRGMSRIFAEVVRRASWFYFLFFFILFFLFFLFFFRVTILSWK